MFDKSRRKIVFAVIFSLLALMAVTLTTIYLSNRISLRRSDEEMLRTFVERYTPETAEEQTEEDRPDGQPGMFRGEDNFRGNPRDLDRFGKDEPAFRLSTFYAVTFGENGEVLSIYNGNQSMQSEESLTETAAALLEKGQRSGTYGNMTYRVEAREGYTLVAMIDGTINDFQQKTLIRQMLIIGSVAMAVLAVLSVFIARRIVRPLEENDRRQKRFISDAGHELKTPIAVISANSELLRRQTGDSEWLSNIEYENERMSELVKQLLFLSHAENGDLPKEHLDFSQLVTGEVLPFESLAFEKGRQLESEIEPGLMVEGNPNQLRQLVSILLDNALSHGTGEAIGLSLRRERHAAVLSVMNEAAEMSKEQLSHLFERFYRTDEARNEAGAHYGLGLSIAKAVAGAHGGEIRVEYKEGKAVFTVTLPLAPH